MNNLKIFCESYDFSPLAAAFDGEYESDCPLAAEIIFSDREGIRSLNAQFRQIDRETDVLSFPTLDGIRNTALKAAEHPFDRDEDGNLFLGSVVICTEVARSQAQEYGHSYERELFYLAAHGMCHLLGYDHMEESDKREMREKEETVLARLHLERD